MSVVVNFHVPKTGGTTMARKLRAMNGRHHLDLYYPPPMSFLDRRHYPDLRLHWGALVKTISSHNLPYHPPEEFWPGARFIVILRDPLEKMVSAFHHVTRGAPHMTFMKDVPAEWRDLESFITCHEGRLFKMTRYLAACEPQPNPSKYLDIALDNLKKYHGIGLTERYQDTLKLFSRIIPGLTVDDVRHNQNEDKPERENYRSALSDRMIRLVESACEEDYVLYREAQRLFEEQLAALARNPAP